jgi:uncharacterized membrane protein YbhN (UPF0104 family)
VAKNKFFRLFLLLVVVAGFIWYFWNNQSQFSRISRLNILDVILIVIGQAAIILSNVSILITVVSFINKRMSFLNSARITAYSSLINFFGFLQGGVGFRGIYLKRYYDMSLKRYAALTTLQYFIFFGTAGLLLLLGLALSVAIGNFVIIAGLILICILVSIALVYLIRPALILTVRERLESVTGLLRLRPIVRIFLATLTLLAGSMLVNAVELHVIGAHVTIGGLLIYTGISQFAIIIAVTPGAVGIREGLLLLVQTQMHLSANDIVVASTIDRLVYFLTLALFTPLALSAQKNIPLLRKQRSNE